MLEDFIIRVISKCSPRGPKVAVVVEDERDIFPDVLVDAIEMAADKVRAFGLEAHPLMDRSKDGDAFVITIRLCQTSEGPTVLVEAEQNTSTEAMLSILRRAARFQDRKLFADQLSLTMLEQASQVSRVRKAMGEAGKRRN